MKIFFDTEFTGLKKNSDLISIGMISENGDTFYAEFTDFDKEIYNDKWIYDNVLSNTLYLKYKNVKLNNNGLVSKTWNNIIGDKKFVKECILKWFELIRNNSTIQLVSDVSHYDMVFFIDLFGKALSLPEYISPVCYDINQLIAKSYKISNYDAFNMNRESILYDNKEIVEGNKHNSLYDAKVIKKIYEIL